MAVFDDYWKEKASWDANHKKEMVKLVPPSENPLFNKSILLQNINDIPNMSDAQLRNFIDHYFDNIIYNVFTGDKVNEHVRCFTDTRFLDAFIDVMQTRKFYEPDIIIKINNICYDYVSLQANKNQDVMNKMLIIARTVNQARMPRLLGLGLNANLALMLIMARYSSLNLEVCVKRVNFIIITQPKVLMTYDMIKEIFHILYGESGIWQRIFQYFMFDVIPEYNEFDPNCWVTEDMEEINSIINLVILDILNSEDSMTIYRALKNYAETKSMIYNNKPIRFTLQTISEDYERIKINVNALIMQEGVYVP